MDTKPQLTLWLWPQGLFPRRLSYYLLSKNLVSSPTDLYTGKTTDANLTIKLIRYIKDQGLIHDDPTDQPPKGASTPCLRIVQGNAKPVYIYESASILLYLDRLYTAAPLLSPTEPLGQAQLDDRLAMLGCIMDHGMYHLKHAVPQTSSWSRLPPRDRSLTTAKHAKGSMVSSFVKFQTWCEDSLSTTGYLTPGIEGPGVVDFALAAQRRYLELTYAGYNLFEDEELKVLRGWYEKFKGGCGWWDELEETEDVHPKELMHPEGCREV